MLEACRAPGVFVGNGGQKFLRLRRAEQFFFNRLRRAWARDFPGSEFRRGFFGSDKQSAERASSSSSSNGSGGGRTAAPASLSAAPVSCPPAARRPGAVWGGYGVRPRSILTDSFSAAASMASTAIKAAGGVKPLPCWCVCACCVCRPDLPAAAPSAPLGTQNV